MGRGRRLGLLSVTLILLLMWLQFSTIFSSAYDESTEVGLYIPSPPSTGDWLINSEEDIVLNGETLIVNGSILLFGSLTVIDSHLEIIDDEQILVQDGGNLTVISSNITRFANGGDYFNIRALSGSSLQIDQSNLTFLGHGYYENAGIAIETHNVELTNNYFAWSDWQVYVGYNCDNITIKDNVFEHGWVGLYVHGSENVSVIGNQFYDYGATDLVADWPHEVIIKGNYVSRNPWNSHLGIRIQDPEIVVFSENVVVNGGYDLDFSYLDWELSTIGTNYANGKPIAVLHEESDTYVEDIGQIFLFDCDDITIHNNVISFVQMPVYMKGSSGIRIYNNDFNEGGGNPDNTASFITMIQSNDIQIYSNSFANITWGMRIYTCSGVQVYSNVFEDITIGIAAQSSERVHIFNNEFRPTGSSNADTFRMDLCDEILIYLNTVNVTATIFDINTSNLTVFYNNFRNYETPADDTHAYTYHITGTGNYWDNYTGSDGNMDGIGDTPFYLDGDSYDSYPLMDPIDPATYMIDEDSDGIIDIIETMVYSTNASDEDSDIDGWDDYSEILIYGTDPLDDTDYPGAATTTTTATTIPASTSSEPTTPITDTTTVPITNTDSTTQETSITDTDTQPQPSPGYDLLMPIIIIGAIGVIVVIIIFIQTRR